MGHTQPPPSNPIDPTVFESSLRDVACEVEVTLDEHLPNRTQLDAVIRYASLKGGKRFRPFLTVAVGTLYQVERQKSLLVGAALELVHIYSLIHDDLPAMDNADLRRGKPSCHMQYDEASAILAGDALIPLAFELLSDPDLHTPPQVQLALTSALARAIGPQGMPLGQMMDLGLEGMIQSSEDLLALESLKTGVLIACACEFGAILGQAPASEREALRQYGMNLGLAFQIADDLLDCTSTPAALGKPTARDFLQNKATFVSLLGWDAAQAKAQECIQNAIDALSALSTSTNTLKDAAYFALSRAQ